MNPLTLCLLFSCVLFGVGLAGALCRGNAILVLLGIELMLNAVNINLVAFGAALHDLTRQGFALVVITVAAAEVGVRFRSHVKGWITGILFYKSAANTGRHVATLWTAKGAKLASAVFTAETASGWQQANFARRVPIRADETYVASYHTDAGHYSADPFYFVAGRDNGTLEFLESTSKSGNGVYQQGAGSAFPTKSRQWTNYWVDVVFSTG